MSLTPVWTNGIIVNEMTMLGAILTTLGVLLIGAGLPNFKGGITDPEIGAGKILVGVVDPPENSQPELERRLLYKALVWKISGPSVPEGTHYDAASRALHAKGCRKLRLTAKRTVPADHSEYGHAGRYSSVADSRFGAGGTQALHADDQWWFRVQTYAASDATWSAVSCAPPMGGIALHGFRCGGVKVP